MLYEVITLNKNLVTYNIDDYTNSVTTSSIHVLSESKDNINPTKKSVEKRLFSTLNTESKSDENTPPVAGLTYVILSYNFV